MRILAVGVTLAIFLGSSDLLYARGANKKVDPSAEVCEVDAGDVSDAADKLADNLAQSASELIDQANRPKNKCQKKNLGNAEEMTLQLGPQESELLLAIQQPHLQEQFELYFSGDVLERDLDPTQTEADLLAKRQANLIHITDGSKQVVSFPVLQKQIGYSYVRPKQITARVLKPKAKLKFFASGDNTRSIRDAVNQQLGGDPERVNFVEFDAGSFSKVFQRINGPASKEILDKILEGREAKVSPEDNARISKLNMGLIEGIYGNAKYVQLREYWNLKNSKIIKVRKAQPGVEGEMDKLSPKERRKALKEAEYYRTHGLRRDLALQGVLEDLSSGFTFRGQPIIQVAKYDLSLFDQHGILMQDPAIGVSVKELTSLVMEAKRPNGDSALHRLKLLGFENADDATQHIQALQAFYYETHHDVLQFILGCDSALNTTQNATLNGSEGPVGFDFLHGKNAKWDPEQKKFVIFDW